MSGTPGTIVGTGAFVRDTKHGAWPTDLPHKADLLDRPNRRRGSDVGERGGMRHAASRSRADGDVRDAVLCPAEIRHVAMHGDGRASAPFVLWQFPQSLGPKS